MKHVSFLSVALMFSVIGCSVNKAESIVEESPQQEDVSQIIFTAESFRNGDALEDTKTSVIPNGDYSYYDFIWSAADTVGIFPNEGSQVHFTMASGAGTSSAKFDGGAWTCKEGYEYRSYYPFIGNYYLDATKIPVSFKGQKQIGNANSDHFQKYDYMFAPPATKEGGNLNFSYEHLIAAVLPWAELPAGHYVGLTLSLDEALFVTEGEYDLTAPTPAIVGKKYSPSLHIDLDVIFSESNVLKVYVPIAPMNISGKTLTVSIWDDEGYMYSYTYNPSKVYTAGNIYRIRAAEALVRSASVCPEAVDLGLSVKWASFNLGATAPEEFGDYYAWGEVETYYSSLAPITWKEGKSNGYNWGSYKWCNGGSYKRLTKYCSSENLWDNEGSPDGKTQLDSADDIAHISLGNGWRLPTYSECQELVNNCIWTRETQNGISGRLITSKINGNSIFLPDAGDLVNAYVSHSHGRYWSSSRSNVSTRAWALIFDSIIDYELGDPERTQGYPIRPVID